MVTLSRVEIADLPALIELECQLFNSDCISRRQFKYLLTKARSVAVKISENEVLCGYMILLKRKRCSNLRIYSIGIETGKQNKGYGQILLDFAEKVAVNDKHSSVTLEVCENNSAAIKFYKAAGYVLANRRKGYYEDGCTALVLRKDIKKVTI